MVGSQLDSDGPFVAKMAPDPIKTGIVTCIYPLVPMFGTNGSTPGISDILNEEHRRTARTSEAFWQSVSRAPSERSLSCRLIQFPVTPGFGTTSTDHRYTARCEAELPGPSLQDTIWTPDTVDHPPLGGLSTSDSSPQFSVETRCSTGVDRSHDSPSN